MYCAKTGCNLPAFVEPRTKIVHKYCGRTHAVQAMGRHAVQKPHGTCQRCNLAGCDKTVAFDLKTGRVHDFCCKEHADRAIRSGAWVKPVRDQYRHYHGGKKNAAGGGGVDPGFLCQLPSCNLPVFRDPRTGRKFDYCGRSHAVEHRLSLGRNNSNPSTVTTAAVAGGGSVILRAGGAIISSDLDNDSVEDNSYNSGIGSSNNSMSRSRSSSSKNSFAKAGPTIGYVTSAFLDHSGGTFGTLNRPSQRGLPPDYGHLSSHAVGRKLPGKMSPGTGQNMTTASSVAKKLAPPVATVSINNHNPTGNHVARKPPPPMAATTSTSAAATKPPPSTSPGITHPQCTVCLGRNANIILIPCGHVCLCQEDADKLKANKQLNACPICRQSITSTNKVFLNHS